MPVVENIAQDFLLENNEFKPGTILNGPRKGGKVAPNSITLINYERSKPTEHPFPVSIHINNSAADTSKAHVIISLDRGAKREVRIEQNGRLSGTRKLNQIEIERIMPHIKRLTILLAKHTTQN